MDSSYYFNYNSSDDEDLIDHHQSNLPPLGQRNIHNDGANIRVQENNIPILGPCISSLICVEKSSVATTEDSIV